MCCHHCHLQSKTQESPINPINTHTGGKFLRTGIASKISESEIVSLHLTMIFHDISQAIQSRRCWTRKFWQAGKGMERLRTSRWQRKISTTTPHAKFSDSIGSVKFPSDQWWYWNHLKSMGSPLFLGSKGTWSLLIAQCRNNAEMSTVKLQSESSKNSEPFGTNTSSHYSTCFSLQFVWVQL